VRNETTQRGGWILTFNIAAITFLACISVMQVIGRLRGDLAWMTSLEATLAVALLAGLAMGYLAFRFVPWRPPACR